jgi:hypothetical protein
MSRKVVMFLMLELHLTLARLKCGIRKWDSLKYPLRGTEFNEFGVRIEVS